LSLLSLTAASVVPATLAELSAPRILDLSEPFLDEYPDNSDAAFIEQYITRDVRRFLVVDDGEIVMDYQRDTVNDDDVFRIWSATKATMSMIIGTIIFSDEYDLSLDDTLGELFTGENDWTAIEDPDEIDFKQNITIFELLTQSSGLVMLGQELTQALSFNPLTGPIDTANGAGVNLRQSLAFHSWNATMKGEFEYLEISNVLSYVIVEVTGMTPLEYVSIDVFPSLGIDTDKIEWEKNHGGVETSLSSLSLTARDMAKIGQLYMQKGLAAPDKRLVSEEYVESSLSEINLGLGLRPHGYMWHFFSFNKTLFPNTIGDGIYCGAGFMGQAFCFNYEAKRIVAYQRSNTVWDIGNWDLLTEMGEAAFSANFTFNETIESVASGALSHSVLWGPLAKFTLTWIAFWL